MNKNQYIGLPVVGSFVDWLCKNLPNLQVALSIAPSPRVPGGVYANLQGIDQVLLSYRWRSAWTDSHGEVISADDWVTTQASIASLGNWLSSTHSSGPDINFKAACKAVLDWGGVPHAKGFIDRKSDAGALITYFNTIKTRMTLANADVGLPWNNIEDFNSGLTKIHAMLSTDGLPIYDSRVGAAIGGLVAMSNIRGKHLIFPSGGARGSQVRNAGVRWGNDWNQPQMHTAQLTNEDWAKAAVKLGWIMEAVLTRCPELLSSKELYAGTAPSLVQRMHALEAALFMIGYDLQSIYAPAAIVGATTTNAKSKSSSKVKKPASALPTAPVLPCAPILWGWPLSGSFALTSHPFSAVIESYHNFRGINPGNTSVPDFSDWLANQYGFSPATANSYCFPLRGGQFDIASLSDAEVDQLANHPIDQTATAWLRRFRSCTSSAIPTCLIAVFLVGTSSIRGYATRTTRIGYFVEQGFAGTRHSAGIVHDVGGGIGKHFGLLDDHCNPTGRFFELFY